MGTTAEKLQAVLNSKNAIKTKFNLADDLPFSRYADNINAGGTGGGGSGEFYLCKYVNRNYYNANTIEVSGMPTDAFVGSQYMDMNTYEMVDLPAEIASRNPNGTYTLQDPTKEPSSSNYWVKDDGCIITFASFMVGNPVILPVSDDDYMSMTKYIYIPSGDNGGPPEMPAKDDYTSYEWYHCGPSSTADVLVEGGSVVYPRPPEVEKYWLGYLLNMNEDGKWEIDYSAEVRKTYDSYMPVAGRIYDGACTMEILNLNIAEEFLLSTPTDMTANENDEWLVSASNEYVDKWGDNSTHYAYLAFDGDETTYCWIQEGSLSTVAWQNKLYPVMLKRLEVHYADFYHPANIIQASNDGVNWITIPYTAEEKEGSVKVFTLTNYTFYTHYRLHSDSFCRWLLYSIKGYWMADREVPK